MTVRARSRERHGKLRCKPHTNIVQALFCAMKIASIAPFFAILAAANPEPKTELEYSTPFELLAAVLLSAQATDVGVNKATRRLFPVANTPQALLDMGLETVQEYLKTIGL